MRRFSKLLAATMAISLTWLYADADPISDGLYYSHKDWELACDNTRTCRAAGYQADGSDQAVSLLLTRKAGAHTAVSAMVQIGSYLEEEEIESLNAISALTMWINGKPHGSVELQDTTAKLSPEQVSALIAVLHRNSSIEWRSGERRWTLSDKGATAVLLKMDEFQGRLDTPGALIKKGQRDEGSVLPPLPVPVVVAAPLSKSRAQDKRLESDYAAAVLAALRRTVTDGECPALYEADTKPSVNRLSDSLLLLSAPCELYAYNYDVAFWLMNDQLPYAPKPIPFQGTDYSQGVITSTQKGRGLGDCWSMNEWTWNGEAFIPTSSSSTGMCKLVAAGGAWDLPTVVTEVQHSSNAAPSVTRQSPAKGRLLQISPQVAEDVGVNEIMLAVQSGIMAVYPMVDKSTIKLTFREAYDDAGGFIPGKAIFSVPQELLVGPWDDERRAGMAEELLASMRIGPINGCPTVVIDDQWSDYTVEPDPEKPLRIMELSFGVGC